MSLYWISILLPQGKLTRGKRKTKNNSKIKALGLWYVCYTDKNVLCSEYRCINMSFVWSIEY